MKVTTYGGQTIYLPAGQVLVESEALDSLKTMAQRLQQERDELLNCLVEYIAAADQSMDGEDDVGSMIRFGDADKACRAIIAKCTSKPEILA